MRAFARPILNWTRNAFRVGQEDDDIDFSDIPELDEEFFKHAKLRGPMIQLYSALVDRDVYEWFQSMGPDYLERMNQVLREHMLASQGRTDARSA